MITKTVYVVAVERLDGSLTFLKGVITGTRSSANNGLTNDPANARHFDYDVDKEEILQWMDTERGKISRYANIDKMVVATYECKIEFIPSDDIEWRTVLQRNGVSKLSTMEIEALGLAKYEIERRLAS